MAKEKEIISFDGFRIKGSTLVECTADGAVVIPEGIKRIKVQRV